eukprot:gene19360-biopygen33835
MRSEWGTAAGASLGSLYTKVAGGEGSLPVATPDATPDDGPSGGEGTTCFAKCDGAWCNGHGSAHVGSDGRCKCTCFSALGWAGLRCDECGGSQPFFPVRASGGEITDCTLCTNRQHCNGRAEQVVVNATGPGCECSCVHGYNGGDCSKCADGFARSNRTGVFCEPKRAPCMVEYARGDIRGAISGCEAGKPVPPQRSCSWTTKKKYTCSPSTKRATCGDASFERTPYCQLTCDTLDEADCMTSKCCILAFPVSTAYELIESFLMTLTSLVTMIFVASNYQQYGYPYSLPVFCKQYKWFHVVLDTLSACMIVTDVGLDINACAQAVRYDALRGRHARSTVMIVILVASHLMRIGLELRHALHDEQSCCDVAKRAAAAAAMGPLDDMRKTVRIVIRLARDGAETDLNVHLRQRLVAMGLVEMLESVPQLAVQYYFIAELRSSRGYLALDNTAYFFAFASPCISVAMIVKALTGWAAIRFDRRTAAGRGGVVRAARTALRVRAA